MGIRPPNTSARRTVAEDCCLLHTCPHHAFVVHGEWEAIAAHFALLWSNGPAAAGGGLGCLALAEGQGQVQPLFLEGSLGANGGVGLSQWSLLFFPSPPTPFSTRSRGGSSAQIFFFHPINVFLFLHCFFCVSCYRKLTDGC